MQRYTLVQGKIILNIDSFVDRFLYLELQVGQCLLMIVSGQNLLLYFFVFYLFKWLKLVMLLYAYYSMSALFQ